MPRLLKQRPVGWFVRRITCTSKSYSLSSSSSSKEKTPETRSRAQWFQLVASVGTPSKHPHPTLSLHKVGPGELWMNLPRVQLWRRNHLQRSKWFLWQALNIFISAVTLNTDSCWSRHQVDNGGTAFCCSTLPQVNLHNFCWTDGCSC